MNHAGDQEKETHSLLSGVEVELVTFFLSSTAITLPNPFDLLVFVTLTFCR